MTVQCPLASPEIETEHNGAGSVPQRSPRGRTVEAPGFSQGCFTTPPHAHFSHSLAPPQSPSTSTTPRSPPQAASHPSAAHPATMHNTLHMPLAAFLSCYPGARLLPQSPVSPSSPVALYPNRYRPASYPCAAHPPADPARTSHTSHANPAGVYVAPIFVPPYSSTDAPAPHWQIATPQTYHHPPAPQHVSSPPPHTLVSAPQTALSPDQSNGFPDHTAPHLPLPAPPFHATLRSLVWAAIVHSATQSAQSAPADQAQYSTNTAPSKNHYPNADSETPTASSPFAHSPPLTAQHRPPKLPAAYQSPPVDPPPSLLSPTAHASDWGWLPLLDHSAQHASRDHPALRISLPTENLVAPFPVARQHSSQSPPPSSPALRQSAVHEKPNPPHHSQ